MPRVDLIWILINKTADWRNVNTDWYLMILKKFNRLFLSHDHEKSPYLPEVDAEILKGEVLKCWDWFQDNPAEAGGGVGRAAADDGGWSFAMGPGASLHKSLHLCSRLKFFSGKCFSKVLCL